MYKKTFRFEFGWYESISQTIYGNSKTVIFEDVCNQTVIEVQNLLIQQISMEFEIPFSQIGFFEEDNKPYFVEAFEGGGEYFITISVKNEEELNTLINTYYNQYLYTLMTTIYSYYDIDITNVKERTMVYFEDSTIEVTYGTENDYKNEE